WVAMRMAEEAKKRQVIVFTHDVYFLCILQQEAELAGVNFSPLSLHKKPEGFGVADPELPFEGATTKKRVGMLRQKLIECKRLYEIGDVPEYRRHARDAYFHLRLAWERAVEEVLLGNVVIRFREGVETSRLKGVVVENDDYVAVDKGMTKCSKYAHDKAAIGNIAVPRPEELTDDINSLETWRKKIESRSQNVRNQRTGSFQI
ncbi:MAG: AAA family ATPase, partial [Arenimonas sp.]